MHFVYINKMLVEHVFDRYMDKIADVLRIHNFRIIETDFGYVVEKGNFNPSKGVDEITIYGLKLDLRGGKVLHERVLVIKRDIGIRSHEEERQEIVKNIGEKIVIQATNKEQRRLAPRQARYSVHLDSDGLGFYHGFKLVNDATDEPHAVIYVAKALKPEYVDSRNDSFIVPPNSFKS